MAPEAIFERKFTTKSDVWSFGVLVWEIMTMGESPFRNDPVKLYFEKLRDGVYLEQPLDCSDEIYAIMKQCWSYQPDHRPTWADLVHQLQTLVIACKKYNLSRHLYFIFYTNSIYIFSFQLKNHINIQRF